MKVQWTLSAALDREEITTYIATENPKAAVKMDRLFVLAAAKLKTLPNRGRPGSMPGTRELMPHANYRLVYKIEADNIFIIALIHIARRWPP